MNAEAEGFRPVYEKILLAWYLHRASWDGQKFRLSLDDCLDWLLTRADRDSLAFLQYQFLGGRSEAFMRFLQSRLAPGQEETALRAALWERQGAPARARLAVALEQGKYPPGNRWWEETGA
ncbi:conserved protein of unknown function [Candidatus Hydrogenisulfobacillus filiaventi]|uniref:Uncharacterized protein n=1 Tax=Candidatus Hydrogenisulfobacillus filiaventi TaxID=2707344 RepID=A0A6F8ZJ45_9FIRM|nr:conserved protein of unknown function [Candidatus Hydrogenisulfobacillus filiaventi]